MPKLRHDDHRAVAAGTMNAPQGARADRQPVVAGGVSDNMRPLLCLALYLAMVVFGAVLSAGFFTNGGRGIIFITGGFLIAFGGYLIWNDFLSPNRGPL